jgi:hypothetical protein
MHASRQLHDVNKNLTDKQQTQQREMIQRVISANPILLECNKRVKSLNLVQVKQ